MSFTYDAGVLGITPGHYVGRLAQVKTMAGSSVLYNYSTAGYDEVGQPLGYVECPIASDCTTKNRGTDEKYPSGRREQQMLLRLLKNRGTEKPGDKKPRGPLQVERIPDKFILMCFKNTCQGKWNSDGGEAEMSRVVRQMFEVSGRLLGGA